MKNRVYKKWGLGFLLALAPLAGGCLQQETDASEPTTTSSGNLSSTNSLQGTNTANTGTNAIESADVPEVDIAEAPVKAVAMEKKLPANIRSTGPVGDVVKLAESGLEEGVLLAFVTNSPSMFSLTAEEIIYLNDVGVPSSVVTAMLQHDQELKGAATTETAASSEQAPAPAPLAAADMAPQNEAPPPATAQEAAPEVQAAPATAPTSSTFYESLSPYGTWVQVDGYGLCWQPTVVVVNPSWQPYFDSGRWVYTDYGWYWSSTYSWGWAPFHYGRWFRHNRLGWCWYPGYVWGPSWVTWRYNSGYCGWAPLPPCAVYSPSIGLTYWGGHVGVGFTFGIGIGCYSFVSWNHFHDHHLHHYALAPEHRDRIYHQTVVATRIVGNRDRVFNHGISADRVATASRTPVQRVTLRETSNLSGRSIRSDQMSPDGRSMTVYRPHIREEGQNRITKVEPRSSERGAATRVSPEAAPARALKPVRNTELAATQTRAETRVDSAETTRPVPARALTDERFAARTRTVISERAISQTANQRGNPPASSVRPTTPVSRPATQSVVTRSAPTAPVTSQASSPAQNPRGNLTYNWQRPAPTTPAPVTPPRPMPSTSARANSRSYTTTVPSTSRSAEVPRYNVPEQNRYNSRSQATPSAPQRYAPAPSPAYQAPSRTQVPTYSPPAPAARQAPVQRQYTAPSRSIPTPAPAPSYSAPQRSYSPPAPAARPSYTPPQQSYSAPSRSYSAPQPSSPPPSGNSGGASPSYSRPSRR